MMFEALRRCGFSCTLCDWIGKISYRNLVNVGDSRGILVVIYHIQSFMLLGICKLPIKIADEIHNKTNKNQRTSAIYFFRIFQIEIFNVCT